MWDKDQQTQKVKICERKQEEYRRKNEAFWNHKKTKEIKKKKKNWEKT